MGAVEIALLLGALYALLFLPPLYFQRRLRRRDLEDEEPQPAGGGPGAREPAPERSLPETVAAADVVTCPTCRVPNDARFDFSRNCVSELPARDAG